MVYVIEKGIKPPEEGKGKYPFNRMDAGDSFFFTDNKSNITNAMWAFGKKNGMKFMIAEARKGTENGWRCWRLT